MFFKIYDGEYVDGEPRAHLTAFFLLKIIGFFFFLMTNQNQKQDFDKGSGYGQDRSERTHSTRSAPPSQQQPRRASESAAMSSTKRNPFDYRERMKNRENANPLAGRNPADFDHCDPYGNPIRDRYDPLAGRNPGMFFF